MPEESRVLASVAFPHWPFLLGWKLRFQPAVREANLGYQETESTFSPLSHMLWLPTGPRVRRGGGVVLQPLSKEISVTGSLSPPPYSQDFSIMSEWVSEVAQSCPTLCDPMDCSLQGSSVHGIFQARVLEWVAISFSRGSSWPRDQTLVSHIAGRRFTVWATREVPIMSERFLKSLEVKD